MYDSYHDSIVKTDFNVEDVDIVSPHYQHALLYSKCVGTADTSIAHMVIDIR